MDMQKYFILLLVLGFLFTGCTAVSNSDQKHAAIETKLPITAQATSSPVAQDSERKIITRSELIKHNKLIDCWLLIDTQVYDVTDYLAKHPGGKAILQGCGTDATKLFESRPMGSKTPHSQKARDLLGNYLLGKIE